MNMDDETTEAERLLTMNIAFQRSLEVEGWHSPCVSLALCVTRPVWHSPCVALALCVTRTRPHRPVGGEEDKRRRGQSAEDMQQRRVALPALPKWRAGPYARALDRERRPVSSR